MSSQELPSVQRHAVYYFAEGSYIFQVENTLYKLHKDILSTASRTFRDMFAASRDAHLDTVDGASDERPIFLPDISTMAFEALLAICYGRWSNSDGISDQEVTALLRLSSMYMCPHARTYSIHRILNRHWFFEPLGLLKLALECNAKKLFYPAFQRLLFNSRLNDLPPVEIYSRIPLTVYVALATTKEILDEHRRTVACEPPDIEGHHVASCMDHRSCERDWRKVWWNGMGRYLLDARNQQPYDDAVKRFESLSFGRMSRGCRENMMRVIKQKAAFKHVDQLVQKVCNHLVDSLITEPSYDD